MTIKCHNEYFKSKFYYFKLFLKQLNDHYDIIKASLVFMSCLETVWKEGQNCSIQIAISQGLIGIFACSFLRYDPWNNAVKAVMKKQNYKSLSFEL